MDHHNSGSDLELNERGYQDYNRSPTRRMQNTFIQDTSGPSSNMQNIYNYQVPNLFEYDILSQPKRTTSIHRNASHVNRGSTLKQSFMARVGGWQKSDAGNAEHFLQDHANKIVTKMEEDSKLMEDSPSSELLRKEALRDMPQCLTIKRQIKHKLAKSVSQKSKRKPISCYKQMKYHLSMKFSKFKNSLRDLSYTFELWYNSLKQIEGHFGSGVASYFRFLRWMFIFNCLITLLPLCFIVIPEISCLTVNDPRNCHFRTPENFTPKKFYFKDVFTGEGYFTNTLFYYGYYLNGSISLSGSSYNMPQAYFFTMVLTYVFCFIALSISAATSYRKSFIETEGGLKNVYAQKIFCGWDYSIATKKAADLKASAVYVELKELLSDCYTSNTKNTFLVRMTTVILQIITNILVLSIIATLGYGILKFITAVPAIYFAILINLVMLILPPFFSFIVRYEDYKNPVVTFGITLFRSYLLGVVILGVLTEFYLEHSEKVDCFKETNSWETCLAQEMYRLILFDFLFSIILTTVIQFLVYIFSRLCGKTESILEFDIASNTLHIIYNQMLLWIGLIFSPLLGLLVVIKLFILWYLKQISVMKFCKPSAKTWRAAKIQTWFLIMAFFSCLLIISVHGYTIFKISPSFGPFYGAAHMYEVIIDVENYVSNNYFKFYQPAIITFIIFAICIRIYYLRAKSYAQAGLIKILREMMIWESKDKEFLLQYISKVTKGQWQYQAQFSRMSDPLNSAPEMPGKRKPSRQFSRETSEDHSMLDSSLASTSGINLPSFLSNDTQLDVRCFSRHKKFY